MNKRELKLKQMALKEPRIDLKPRRRSLRPRWFLAGDHGIIRDEPTSRDFPPYSDQPALHLP